MSVPKNFRKTVRIHPSKIGEEERKQYLDDINYKGTFLPKSVSYEDIDQGFIDFLDKDLDLNINGEKVPVIFLSMQRWAEFSKTWELSDEYRDISVPFITIVRKPNPQEGTIHNSLWNIPGVPVFSYIKVPTWDGNRKGVDIYKIPQPIAVDLNYEVRFFTNKMREINKMNNLMLKKFSARQHYLSPNGHYMPLHMENVVDESTNAEFQKRRFYVQLYELLLRGYTQDENDYKIVPAINRIIYLTEVDLETPKTPKIRVTSERGGAITYGVVMKPGSDSHFIAEVEYDINFQRYEVISNVNSITLTLDGVVKTLPFVATAGQTLRIDVNRDISRTAKFEIIGNLL